LINGISITMSIIMLQICCFFIAFYYCFVYIYLLHQPSYISHLQRIKEPPHYQIIHYGGAVGIQIGTLITVGNMYPNHEGQVN